MNVTIISKNEKETISTLKLEFLPKINEKVETNGKVYKVTDIIHSENEIKLLVTGHNTGEYFVVI